MVLKISIPKPQSAYSNLKAVLVGALLAFFAVSHASAHPHAWVSLSTEFIINDEAQLTEIRQRWLFDDMYSALTIDGIYQEYPDFQAGLNTHGESIVTYLDSVNYYSNLQTTKNLVEIPKPSHWLLTTVNDRQQLVLELHFTLSKPVDISDPFQWRVFDPTYYVSMEHETIEFVSIINDSTSECQPELLQGDPSEEQIRYAASLDKSQQAENGLGKYFAQTVTVACY